MDKKTIYKSTMAKADDGTITLSITLPVSEIKKVWELEVENAVKNAVLPGFRQGKAPRKLVEESLDKEKIKEQTLKSLLPQAYISAVEEHKIKPIINPRIHVEKFDDPTKEEKDWVFTAQTCEVPDVKLNKYKEEVQKMTAKSKIVIPGKEQPKPSFDQIVEAMLKEIEVKVPQILIDGEVERQLSQLLGEIKKLGLSLDQYLASTNKTTEVLRDEYVKKAQGDVKIEFALQKIAEQEKITVEPKEIDEAILKAKSPEEKAQLEQNRYLLANILRQQKTLDFLKNL